MTSNFCNSSVPAVCLHYHVFRVCFKGVGVDQERIHKSWSWLEASWNFFHVKAFYLNVTVWFLLFLFFTLNLFCFYHVRLICVFLIIDIMGVGTLNPLGHFCCCKNCHNIGIGNWGRYFFIILTPPPPHLLPMFLFYVHVLDSFLQTDWEWLAPKISASCHSI